MTQQDLELFDALKLRCMLKGVEAPKAKILRAAIRHLATLSDDSLADKVRRVRD